MTDRTAVIKLYDTKFQEFVRSETSKEVNIHYLNYNAQMKRVSSEAEEAYVKYSGKSLGRDKDPQFFNFQKDKYATVWFIRMACEIWGGGGG